jgi:hypothetical protein
MHGSYAFSTDYAAPHYEQARQWHRFARLLRRVRRRAYDCKEEALAWSLARGTRALCFPLALDTRPAHDRGLFRLLRRMYGYGGPSESESSVPQRFPELEARTVYLDDEDAQRVELLLHTTSPGGMASLLPIGYLPEDDGAWSIPLLQQHLALQFFVYDLTPGTAQRGAGGLSATAEVLVVVAGAHEAGRTWIDIYDDRRNARAEHWTLWSTTGPFVTEPPTHSFYGSYLQSIREPAMDNELHADIGQRETCLSDLSGTDYRHVALRL